MASKYNASDLFIKALENEGVEYIFGIPGEENLDLLEALRKSKKIKLILNRHEQAAGFMAATYGRATGKVGVVLTTLGPGATNLHTAAAYAKLGGFPVLFITGQKPIRKSKQGQFQIIDVIETMRPIVKYTKQVVDYTMVSSIVRESFRVALEEKMGPTHIEFPEDISALPVEESEMGVFKISKVYANTPSEESINEVAKIISNAKHPLILVGSGCNRAGISDILTVFVNNSGIKCISTQMGKGVVAEDNEHVIGACALSSQDYIHEITKKADVIVNIGYDVAEKPPYFVDFEKTTVIHINNFSAIVDNIYNPQHEIVADISNTVKALSKKISRGNWDYSDAIKIRNFLKKQAIAHDSDNSFPMKPQRIVSDVNKIMAKDGILALDNGMYKLWFARNYETLKPNTLLLDNALATMGAGLPSAMEMARINPNKKVLAVAGDGGFMMNSQELETAVRLNLNLTVLLLNDNSYGMIRWKQNAAGMDDFGMTFKNPNFVDYANSYGAKGYRVDKAEDFSKILEESFKQSGVKLVEVAIDYEENKKVFTQELENKVKVI